MMKTFSLEHVDIANWIRIQIHGECARINLRQRVGDGHDLNHAALDQSLDTLPNGRSGKPNGRRELCIGCPAVALQQPDQLVVDLVQWDPGDMGTRTGRLSVHERDGNPPSRFSTAELNNSACMSTWRGGGEA